MRFPRSLAFKRVQDLDVQYYTPSSRNIGCVANLSHSIDANFPKQSYIPQRNPVFCQRSMSRDSEVAAKRKDTRQRGSGPVFLWSVKGAIGNRHAVFTD
jgi:hypothetical protein